MILSDIEIIKAIEAKDIIAPPPIPVSALSQTSGLKW